MLKGRTKRYLQAIAFLLTFAIFAGNFTAAAEATQNYNTTHIWLIDDQLTSTAFSEDVFNKYEDGNFETNTAEIFTYNESGEVDYTYSLSGSVGDATASLDLNFWHNTNDLGNAPYDSAVAEGSETFLTETDGTNFMNSVYGFGIGWSLDIPQIEYINSSTAYFHNGEGKAYRIGAVAPENEDEETTYKLCGFPYDYTIEKNITFESEEDTEGTLQGFIGTDRYGNRDYFNCDGRFIKSEDKNGTVLSSVSYNEDNLISTYSGEDYTLNFVRTAIDDTTEEINLDMSSDIEETDEEGNTTTTTETEAIHTFTITDGQLVSVYEGEKDSEPEISTETDEENGVTITTTDASENSVAFEYQEETSAILLDSEVDTIESDLSGMDLLLLKKVTVNSESSTAESYAAIDETNETAVAYATQQNESALNETENSIEVYAAIYEKEFRNIGTQSSQRYIRLSRINHDITKNYRDKTKDELFGNRIFAFNENKKVIEDSYNSQGDWYNSKGYQKKTSKTTDTLLYTHTADENQNTNISTLYRHYYKESTVSSSVEYPTTGSGGYGDDWVYAEDTLDDGDVIEYPYVFKSSITKNTKGEVIYYQANDGAEYYYTYDNKGDVERLEFDNYEVLYDSNGNITSFKVGETVLNSYQYNCSADPSLATAVSYANGTTVNNTYDENGNITSIYTPDFGNRYTFTYDTDQRVTSVTDHVNNRKTEYVDTIVEEETTETTEETTEEESTEETEDEPLTKRTAKVYDITDPDSPVLMYSYDVDGDERNITIDSVSLDFSTATEDITNEDEETSTITTSSVSLGENIWYNENTVDSDSLPQSTYVKLGDSTKYSHTFSYDEDKKLTSETSTTSSSSSTLSYTFDDDNNITSVTDGTYTTEYFYDDLKQLVRVNDQAAGITYSYSYDSRGNMLSSSEYTYTTAEDLTSFAPTKTDSYTYSSNEEWKDKLLTFNGNPITYDASGNPLTYNGYTYTWDMGRQLKSISNGTNTYSYTYDGSGIRTSKTVNGITTNYITKNYTILAEYNDSYSINYWYDEIGNPIGFIYKDKTLENPEEQAYIYTKNMQGDITGVLDSSGTLVTQYTYDEWGNITDVSGSLANTIGLLNSLRYRGYYYDNETGYYYLQSRYYNPEIYRFLNADNSRFIGVSGTVVGVNAFAYCENNSINYTDSTGFLKIKKFTFKYNREKAIKYAKKWYDSYNKDYRKYSSDCANFVSQCLYAGGMTLMTLEEEGWHSFRYDKKGYDVTRILGVISYKYKYNWDVGEAWRLADKQYKYFKNSVYANKTIKITKKSDISSLIEKHKIKKGDLMYFDFDKDKKINHATIISSIKKGKIYYSGHTRSQFDQPLTSYFENYSSGIAYVITIKDKIG